MRYDTSQQEGALHSALKPPLDEVVAFPELPTGFERVGETVRCRVQGELQRYWIEHGMMEEEGSFREVVRERGHVEGAMRSSVKSGKSSEKSMKSSGKSMKSSEKSSENSPANSHAIPSIDSSTHSHKHTSPNTPVKTLQTELRVDEAVEKHMTPIKRTSFFHAQQGAKTRKKITGVVFRYQKGFTCAVRQAATVDDFL